MWLADFSIENPVKVTVGVILVCLFGLLSFFGIPVQLTPEVSKPVISVMTRWPGASPEEVEKEIAAKQEEQLQGVEGMTEFKSYCFDSFCEVEMEFLVGTDIDSTIVKVNSRLNQVRDYPEDADKPVVRTVSASSSHITYINLLPLPPSREQVLALQAAHPHLAEALAPILAEPQIDVTRIYYLAQRHPEIEELTVSNPNPQLLRQFAEDKLKPLFEQVKGVAQGDIFGGSRMQLRVVVNPTQLAAHQVTIADLRRALAGENVDISAGDLWEGKRRYVIRTLGRYESVEQVHDTIVAYRDGAPVYVRDLARVELGVAKPEGMAHQRGVNMITIAIQRESGSNVLEVMEGVRRVIAELNDGALKVRGLQLVQSYDETVYIYSATALVKDNIYAGSILAIITLLLFLRDWRSVLVIAVSIPICGIGTFLVIRLLGRSINVISLAGIAFAVGIVVDNANIVLENIFTYYQKGYRPREAASRGTADVWSAILAGTLTNLAVFLPVIFIQEEAGQLFRDISIAISAGIAFSLLVALTVVPVAASRFLREKDLAYLSEIDPQKHWLDAIGHRFVEWVTRVNENLLGGRIGPPMMWCWIALFVVGVLGMVPAPIRPWERWPYWYPQANPKHLAAALAVCALFVPLAFRFRRTAVVAATIAGSLGLSYKLMPNAEYLPEGNKNLVFASLLPPPGYNVEQMIKVGELVEERLRPYWDAKPGTPEAAQLEGPPIDNFFLVARRGMVFMGARSAEPERASELVPVLRKATQGLPGIISFANQSSLFERSLSSGRSIDIEITGPDLPTLIGLGRGIMGKVGELYPPGTETSVRPIPSLDLGSPEIHVVRNAEKAAQRGLNTADLGYMINALVDGAYAGTYWHEGREIDLVIYGDDSFSRQTQDIAQLPIGTPGGELVRIGDVADVVMSSGPEQINRVDRERAITIAVQPGPEVPLEVAMDRIETEILKPLREDVRYGGLYHFHLAGTADKLKQMRNALSGSLLLALLITFLLMAGLYESFVYPVIIMVTVPLGTVGSFLLLWLMSFYTIQRLDALTMLGVIILVGTVVNNAILVIDQALILIRREGMHYRQAIIESTRGRIRPIFMTTGTTVLGLVPLVVLPGAGSELYRGLGAVMLGGLTISTMFTLFLIPLMFCMTYELQDWLWPKTDAAEPALNQETSSQNLPQPLEAVGSSTA